MKTIFFCLFFCLSIFYSCSDVDNETLYPKKFNFDHSIVINEKGFVIGDNESSVEINSRSGNLEEIRNELTSNFYSYIRNLGFGTYVESIEFLSENMLHIKIWENGIINSYTLSANTENENVEILDKNFYISKVIWDKNKKEIKFCLALSLGILDRAGVFFPEIVYNYCEGEDINMEFQKILSDYDYLKNDTLGIYLMDMVYKE